MTDFNSWYKAQKSTTAQSSTGESTGFLSNLPLFNNSALPTLELPKFTLQESSPPVLFGLSYAQRFRLFICCLLLSLLFFILCFAVGLPTLALRPQKFALCFTFGSLLFMSSFAFLKGPYAHLSSMLTTERLPFTAVYLSSMFLTLYCTFEYGGVSGYVYILTCCFVQILSLLWYLVSFLPGGRAGMMVFTNGIKAVLRPVLVGCGLCFKGCFRCVTG